MKTRRKFLTKLGGMAALFALSAPGHAAKSAENASSPSPAGTNGKFFHVVFFWLINEDNKTHSKLLSEARKYTDNIDLIKTKHIGSPADTDRPVIDSSYSYSLILTFDSKKEQDLYQEHPLHKEFINNASSLWTKVQVYDSIELTH